MSIEHDSFVPDQTFEVKVNSGDVFINGKFISQCCYCPQMVGLAIESYLNGDFDDYPQEDKE